MTRSAAGGRDRRLLRVVGVGVALLSAASALVQMVMAAEASGPAATLTLDPVLFREQQTMQAVCGAKCHRLDLFVTVRKGYAEWHNTVQKMVDLGAVATDDQLLDIMDFLYQTQTLIDVNSAEPDDLSIILNVSMDKAREIVARRNKKKLESLDDLKSIGGLDAAVLAAKAPLLVFQ
jgi:hypothetical protein